MQRRPTWNAHRRDTSHGSPWVSFSQVPTQENQTYELPKTDEIEIVIEGQTNDFTEEFISETDEEIKRILPILDQEENYNEGWDFRNEKLDDKNR